MSEYENPFSLGELGNLGRAREEDDLDYLKAWSRRAVKWYEDEKGRLIENILGASKWKKLMDALSLIVDKSDLIDLEYGPEDQTSKVTQPIKEPSEQ